MSRIAILTILAAACTSSTPRTSVVTNTVGAARYTMLPFTLLGNEGRHSASHSSSDFAGTLELRATGATLTLQIKNRIGHVHCPTAIKQGYVTTRQACADPSMQASSTDATLVLSGDAAWSDDILKLRVAKADQHVTLSCREGTLGLACTLVDHHQVFGWRPGNRTVFPQPIVFATRNLHKHYKLDTLELAAWDGQKKSRLTGTLELKEKSAIVDLELDGKPIVMTGHMKMNGRGLWIGVGWVPQMPSTPLLALSCSEANRAFTCEVAADHTVFDKFHRPETFRFTAI